MRYLWVVSFTMIAVGIALTVGMISGLLGTIALVCGVLLLWSGVVKVIVLRIWQSSLTPQKASTATPQTPSPRSDFGQRG
jgi:hypothetical protein